PGARLAVLTNANHNPADNSIAALYADLTGRFAFTFTATVDGRIYARHGTSVDTRLTIIDRIPAEAPLVAAGHAQNLAELLGFIETKQAPRAALASLPVPPQAAISNRTP